MSNPEVEKLIAHIRAGGYEVLELNHLDRRVQYQLMNDKSLSARSLTKRLGCTRDQAQFAKDKVLAHFSWLNVKENK